MANPGKIRVLIVDAEPASRLGLIQVIKEKPSLCVCGDVDSLSDARRWCEQGEPDLVLVDLAMGDGFTFIKELHRWHVGARVVVFTALEDVLTVQRAFQAGASAYVTRRDPLSSLVVALERAVRGERHIGPRVEHMMLNTLACGDMELRGNLESGLSNREREVLRLLGSGLSTREMAQELGVSVKTVETHCHRIKEKLKLKSVGALRRHAALSAAAE
ncbi:MAG: response regulator transcription factor [Prosthecobacter sp.]|nr:response regulator transcription factor [Prosthecobacter sp.]